MKKIIAWVLLAVSVNSYAGAWPPIPFDPTTAFTWTGQQTFNGGIVGGVDPFGISGVGVVTITGGSGTGATNGFRAELIGGNSGTGATGNGAVARIIGGNALSTNGNGGNASFIAGNGSGTGSGGNTGMVAGQGGATGNGGAVTMQSGLGGSTSGASGAIQILSSITTANSGSATGNLSIFSGAGAASSVAVPGGATGTIQIATGAGGSNTGGATGEAGGSAGSITIGTGAGGSTNSTGAQSAGNGGELFLNAGNGGNATAGTGNGGKGGDLYITAGTGGTTVGGTAGNNGNIVNRSAIWFNQGTPAAATVSATLTAAQILTGIITVNQGAGAASAQQLPLATAMDAIFVDSVAGDSFDFSVINISLVAAESASITTNTGWTLVGDMDIQANSAATTKSAGRFRARKTGAGAWVLYRLS